MSECAIGLPNQALKPLVSSFTSKVLQQSPYEYAALKVRAGEGEEVDVLGTKTVPSNKKVFMDSLKVLSTVAADTVFRLYRNGVVVLAFTPVEANTIYEIFEYGIGKEFDEGETWKITALSAAGANVDVSLSGRLELKHNTLFSPVLS